MVRRRPAAVVTGDAERLGVPRRRRARVGPLLIVEDLVHLDGHLFSGLGGDSRDRRIRPIIGAFEFGVARVAVGAFVDADQGRDLLRIANQDDPGQPFGGIVERLQGGLDLGGRRARGGNRDHDGRVTDQSLPLGQRRHLIDKVVVGDDDEPPGFHKRDIAAAAGFIVDRMDPGRRIEEPGQRTIRPEPRIVGLNLVDHSEPRFLDHHQGVGLGDPVSERESQRLAAQGPGDVGPIHPDILGRKPSAALVDLVVKDPRHAVGIDGAIEVPLGGRDAVKAADTEIDLAELDVDQLELDAAGPIQEVLAGQKRQRRETSIHEIVAIRRPNDRPTGALDLDAVEPHLGESKMEDLVAVDFEVETGRRRTEGNHLGGARHTPPTGQKNRYQHQPGQMSH